jgi:hypothetical protein
MSIPTLSSPSTPTKSFWERPEGTTGMVTLAGLGVGGFFLVSAILPTLIAVLGMAITVVGQGIALTILGAILAGLIMVLTNKKFITLTSYMFKSVMRKVTGWFVELDPIGIMKNYIADLVSQQREMDVSIEKLSGQVRICKEKIAKNEKQYNQAMAMAKEAQIQQKQGAFTVNARQAGRLEALNNETLVPLLKTMELNLRALRKYREVTDTVILDIKNEVTTAIDRRESITASYSAIQSAKRIMNGGDDKRELFDQAMEFMVQDYGMKLGEIENFMDTSKGFVEGLDLQNGVFEAEALKKLQQWEQRADSLLLGDSKRLMLEQNLSTPDAVYQPVTINSVDYSRFTG